MWFPSELIRYHTYLAGVQFSHFWDIKGRQHKQVLCPQIMADPGHHRWSQVLCAMFSLFQDRREEATKNGSRRKMISQWVNQKLLPIPVPGLPQVLCAMKS
jgi:hypothetical protein